MPDPATRTRRPVRELRTDAARNREQLLRAATAALLREGEGVPMADIAAEAGVGVATLYRHFPDREALLAELTHRSFDRLLENATIAEAQGKSPIDSLRLFIEASIRQRAELVLPLHGGPAITAPETRRVRRALHTIIRRIVDAGKADGSIRADVDHYDIIVFGSMLSQPRPRAAQWDAACRRLLRSFLHGLSP